MTKSRYIFASLLALLAMLCFPHKAVAQTMQDSTHILIADSLHRLTAVDLHELSQSAETVDTANLQVLPHREDLGGSITKGDRNTPAAFLNTLKTPSNTASKRLAE